MSRRIAPLALVLLSLVPSPASAKEPGTAAIAGPGIDGALLLPSSRHRSLWLEATRPFEPKDPEPFASVLGPRYQATFRIDGCSAKGDIEIVHQEVYPYAVGGPEVFTAGGQTLCGEPLASGWIHAPTWLLQELVERGLPPESPEPLAPGEAAGARVEPAASGRISGIVVVWVVAGLGLALVGAAAAGRPRRRAA